MQWNSLTDFLAMGGYAFYVWGSFGATALVMAAESLLIRRQRHSIQQSLHAEPSAEGLQP